jgi:uncharacterized protein YggE
MPRPAHALLVLAALALSGCSAAAASPAGDPPAITTRGTGTAIATPDTAVVVLGVATRDASATAALAANSERAAAVVDVLRAAGAGPADVRTSQLSIAPTYGTDGSRITGYEVTNMVTARLRDVTGAGAVVDRAAAAAGDAVRVQQISFSVADDSGVRAQARADAVHRAVAQARQLAEAAAVTLGPIRSIVEVPPAGPPVPFGESDAGRAAQAVPVEPGTQELAVVVEVMHDIAG